ncbi:MAG: hypothetical protein O7G84_17890 [Gammaproteobacteria bacterium]|nr:hypothetical protein [Gammaproteobacteria bacterium]
MEYLSAWVLYYASTGLLLWGLVRLMRRWPAGIRQFIVALLVVILCVPATSANLPGNFAPAFVVLVFEMAFQQESDPELAVLALVVGTALMAGFLVVRRLLRRPTTQL